MIWESPAVPDRLTIPECIRCALFLPISVLITGAENPDMLSEKAKIVRGLEALSEMERTALIAKVMDYAQAGRVEYYKT
jgi:hypothetical protein